MVARQNVTVWTPQLCLTVGLLIASATCGPAAAPAVLRVGTAAHAFDHLGSVGDQAEAAASSGANILYVSGVGALGYQGLPSVQELEKRRQEVRTYIRQAKHLGIGLVFGYVCATSIVKLDSFDKRWSHELRAGFRTSVAEWRQQDRWGQALPSWYGGDYQPACMNNPDWRKYERFMVRQQLEAGCDGIFFDNPTVHPRGCYCPWCMEKFGRFLKQQGVLPRSGPAPDTQTVASLREYAERFPEAFLQFRCTIAKDFFSEMRAYARSIKRGALVTANNSLNSPDALFSQCHTYGYNIFQMSQAEDLVVVEDMVSQPRLLPDGRTFEYSPTYKQLRALSHGKPVVAITLAEGDYHTAPELVRLAMAEAAANGASYLSWPTWPAEQRPRMISALRAETDFLREYSELLNHATPRHDVLLFLPFRNWLQTNRCRASELAAELVRANVQFEVLCEEELRSGPQRRVFEGMGRHGTTRSFPEPWHGAKVLLAGARSDFEPGELRRLEPFIQKGGRLVTAEEGDWLGTVRAALGTPSVQLAGGANVRALVSDQPDRTIIHLLNLNVQRLSSFQDQVTPVSGLQVSVWVPHKRVQGVRVFTADSAGFAGPLAFTGTPADKGTIVEVRVPRLEIGAIMLLQ